MAKDDLKNLPPEERIKKLKELEKQRKQEIEEAQKEIKSSEEEINEKHKQQEKVPIPEVGKEDLEGLSEEGKELLRAHKGIQKKEVDQSNDSNSELSEKEKKKKSSKDDSLEKVVGNEKNRMSQATLQGEYGGQQGLMVGAGGYKPLSQLDMPGISQEIKSIYQAVEERGYMTGFEQKKVGYALSEVEKRLEDIETGHYKGFTEETAQAASLIQQIGSNLQGLYRSGKSSYQR